MNEIKEQAAECLRLSEAGKTQLEIAAELGISRDAVYRRLQRAKRDPAIQDVMDTIGTDLDIDMIWFKGENYSARARLTSANEVTISDKIEEICERIASRSPITVKPMYRGGNHLLVISPADIHMGKLAEVMETGDAYDIEIAERRTKDGILGLLEMAKAFGIEAITVNTGNDSLHTDNNRSTTTAGTPQSTTGSIFSMFEAMESTWRWIIDTCAGYAPVHVVFDPSNHPWVSDWMLNRAIMAWFHNDARITFDVKMNEIRHRKYQVYGSSLIGYSHGDGAKEKDLPAMMQYECRKWWGLTQRGYWIIKHKHHKDAKTIGMSSYQQEKDHPGVTVIKTGDMQLDKNVSVEIVRSPSGTDGWHDRNGYVGAIKAVEAFLFHSERGQVARFTYPFY